MNLNTAGWASPLLRLVARLRSEGVNSTTPVTEINGGTISATNADIALVAKGTGATLAQVPDGTRAGGDKRGQFATDLQKFRTTATQVASGNYSVVCGGQNNLASGIFSVICGGQDSTYGTGANAFIGGGYDNRATAAWSATAAGASNQATSNYSFVGGGQSNTAQTNTHAVVCGGNSNTASGANACVASGESNTASGRSTFIGGGGVHTASGSYSAVMGGASGNTRSIVGYHVFPACNQPVSSAAGSTQSALLLLARQTTDATATVLASNNQPGTTTNQVILPNNSAYSFSGEVIAGVTAPGSRRTLNTATRWTADDRQSKDRHWAHRASSWQTENYTGWLRSKLSSSAKREKTSSGSRAIGYRGML
ncbi:MAG: hypothetical protein EBY66_00455 [Candidatus Fonsibacter lacus]|nr:hypothetical protein [Candidatus Fonsibacter lacus]